MDLIPLYFVIATAFCLDLFIGDPHFLPHPIRWMGRAIEILEPQFRRLPFGLVFNGGLFSLTLIFITGIMGITIVYASSWLHPLIGFITQVILLFYCISCSSLAKAPRNVSKALEVGDLETARAEVGHIVGRNTQHLSPTEVTRAAVETVAENFVDGIFSPLFFTLIGGVPGALIYKMINTLDSMVGYKNSRYEDFGKVSARIDDVANYVPARLSPFLIALAAQVLNQRGAQTVQQAMAEGRYHKSPNAGYPEAAFSGALGIKLGGVNTYGHKTVYKPEIGRQFRTAIFDDIKKGTDLMMLASLISCIFIMILSLFS